jgi:monofunctional biosynthetic peptidoglycan transglycosylase
VLLVYVLGIPFLLVVYLVVPPPPTPLMLIRLVEGEGLAKAWRPLEEIAPRLAHSVIAAEDNLFCEHHGFDLEALEEQFADLGEGKRARGASTITMQTAKNLFLWDGRGFLRKALEVYPTLLIELLWSKRRIIEIYLNVVEWGPGIYGAEAAARAHFGKGADELGRREAALLAVVLPNPRVWNAGEPGPYVRKRAGTIAARVDQLGPLLDCVAP